MEPTIIVLVLIGLIATFALIAIAIAIEIGKRQRYREYAAALKASGCKVIYYNETTGTIRYRGKDKRVHSESLYRGYRSHWKRRGV